DVGLSDFGELRKAITRRQHDLYFVAFDLLHLNGHDLRDMPLEDRREILQAMIPAGGRIQFSEALPGTGDAVYHLACETNLEGIVSKRKTSVYRSGPTMNWRKIKCYVVKRMEIIGAQRERGKSAKVLMAENGRYMGSADVVFKHDKRRALWDRVQGKIGAPPPKGLKKDKSEWLKPG
ncbi:MAG: ATP-dependent DNA ligase, partial [Mesorhizobium sp.]